jgi:hypothetical protein
MSDKILIVKYFGQAAPQLMDLARSLPRASHMVSQGLAGEPWVCFAAPYMPACPCMLREGHGRGCRCCLVIAIGLRPYQPGTRQSRQLQPTTCACRHIAAYSYYEAIFFRVHVGAVGSSSLTGVLA